MSWHTSKLLQLYDTLGCLGEAVWRQKWLAWQRKGGSRMSQALGSAPGAKGISVLELPRTCLMLGTWFRSSVQPVNTLCFRAVKQSSDQHWIWPHTPAGLFSRSQLLALILRLLDLKHDSLCVRVCVCSGWILLSFSSHTHSARIFLKCQIKAKCCEAQGMTQTRFCPQGNLCSVQEMRRLHKRYLLNGSKNNCSAR